MQAPGLLAALVRGEGCDGLAFRILKEHVPGYVAVFFDVETAAGSVHALGFVADYAWEKIIPDIDRSEQINYISTASGFAGSNLEYLENLAANLTTLGIEDTDLFALLRDVREVKSRRRK